MSVVSSIFRNLLGKPVAADFRDSAEHFVAVLREQGIQLTFAKEDLQFVDDAGPPLAASDAVFAAVAAAAWNAITAVEGTRPETFPARTTRVARQLRR